jgi:hypothetical protein
VKPGEYTSPIDSAIVVCPYCGESVELLLEADLGGEMVVDCEVCCNPWRVRVVRQGPSSSVEIGRLDD